MPPDLVKFLRAHIKRYGTTSPDAHSGLPGFNSPDTVERRADPSDM